MAMAMGRVYSISKRWHTWRSFYNYFLLLLLLLLFLFALLLFPDQATAEAAAQQLQMQHQRKKERKKEFTSRLCFYTLEHCRHPLRARMETDNSEANITLQLKQQQQYLGCHLPLFIPITQWLQRIHILTWHHIFTSSELAELAKHYTATEHCHRCC